MYYPDLTPYSYWEDASDAGVALNVGWLDDEHLFPVGNVRDEVLGTILWLCAKESVNLFRGYHPSPFVKPMQVFGLPVSYQGRTIRLGAAEIRVVSKTGRIYACPDLIYHYIRDCRYLPPSEFLEAVAHMTHSGEKTERS